MTAFRGGAHELPAPRVTIDPRWVAVALAAALAVALVALVLLLGNSGGTSDQVRIAPSAGPTPPSPAERHQQPGLNGPGARP
jgi:hypothetical protein